MRINFNKVPASIFFKDDVDIYECMKFIVSEVPLIHVCGIGFYEFDKYWIRIEENVLRNAIHRILHESSHPKHIENVLKLLKAEVPLSANDLNKNRNRIVLKNGTLDMTEWANPTFYENKYYVEDYCTIKLDCEYDPKATSVNFEKYLHTTFEDESLIQVVQELLGYVLTPSAKMQKAFIFYGEGANGKSVLQDVISALVSPQNVSSVSINDFSKNFSRYALKDKLVNLSGEWESNITDSKYFKQIVSGDWIDAEKKYHDVITYQPFAKIIVATNKLPNIKDTSHGLDRRMAIIPFSKTFLPNEQDKDLIDKLKMEMDGILMFALEGLKRLGKHGHFSQSTAIDDMVKEFSKSNNIVASFFDECVDFASDSYERVQTVYDEFRTFCVSYGYKTMDMGSFGKEVQRLFKDKVEKSRKRLNGGQINCYMGIRLIKHG